MESSIEKSETASMEHSEASLIYHVASKGEARTRCYYGPIPIDSRTPGLDLNDGDSIPNGGRCRKERREW